MKIGFAIDNYKIRKKLAAALLVPILNFYDIVHFRRLGNSPKIVFGKSKTTVVDIPWISESTFWK